MSKRKSPEDAYLDDLKAGKRMHGQSHPSASGALGKKEGGAGGSFDGKSKLWYATNEKTWIAMYRTGMWRPFDAKINPSIVAQKIREKQEAVERAIAEASSKSKPSDEQVEQHIRRELRIPDDDIEMLDMLERDHGIGRELVAKSGRCAALGPRSGVSNAQRILRALRFNVTTSERLISMLKDT